MYIALEGIKGCGKSTVFDAVAYLLKKRGMTINCLRPTSAANFFIEPFYLRTNQWWPDIAIEWLYAKRSNYHANRLPKPLGGLVLGDRSIFTSYATRWDSDNPERTLARVNRLEYRIPIPNHVIYLSVPVDTALSRIKARPHRCYGRVEQSNYRLNSVDHAYRELALKGHQLGLTNIDWHWIDASAELPVVIATVLSCIDQLLNDSIERSTYSGRQVVANIVPPTDRSSQQLVA